MDDPRRAARITAARRVPRRNPLARDGVGAGRGGAGGAASGRFDRDAELKPPDRAFVWRRRFGRRRRGGARFWTRARRRARRAAEVRRGDVARLVERAAQAATRVTRRADDERAAANDDAAGESSASGPPFRSAWAPPFPSRPLPRRSPYGFGSPARRELGFLGAARSSGSGAGPCSTNPLTTPPRTCECSVRSRASVGWQASRLSSTRRSRRFPRARGLRVRAVAFRTGCLLRPPGCGKTLVALQAIKGGRAVRRGEGP